MQQVIIALGGNLPLSGKGPKELIQSSVERLADKLGVIERQSHWYRTSAVPAGTGPDFVNGAVLVNTKLTPQRVLAELHRIESDMGRERSLRWGPRTVDLDLIAADSAILPDPDAWRHWYDLPPDRQTTETPDQLILPHPRMQDRAFVLVPMMDIVPDWRHPALKRTVAEMHAELTPEQLSGVRLL